MDKLPSPRRAYRHFDLIMVSFVAVMSWAPLPLTGERFCSLLATS